MSSVICKQCRGEFPGDGYGESLEFDMHDCPAMPPMLPFKEGESWEEYRARCLRAAQAEGWVPRYADGTLVKT